jgi:hypothetical protein
LKPCVVSAGNLAITGLEKALMLGSEVTKSMLGSMAAVLHDLCKPLLKYSIHKDVEESGGVNSSLSFSSAGLKRHAMVAALMGNKDLVGPEVVKESDGVGANNISFEDTEGSFSDYHVICLGEVNKD